MGEESTIEPMLTPAQVAKLFSVDPKTVSRWARCGRIRAHRTPGGHHRFHREDVDALLNADALPDEVVAEHEQRAAVEADDAHM